MCPTEAINNVELPLFLQTVNHDDAELKNKPKHNKNIKIISNIILEPESNQYDSISEDKSSGSEYFPSDDDDDDASSSTAEDEKPSLVENMVPTSTTSEENA